LHECKTTKDWSGGYLPIAMCGHKGEKLRTKLGAPEIVHECKTTKEIIQSIQRSSFDVFLNEKNIKK